MSSLHDPDTTDDAPDVPLDAVLDAALDADARRLAPASIIALAHGGTVITVRAWGSPHNDETQTTRGTVFRIASMTKSFLAATALALRDEGQFDLNRPITDYVPGVVIRYGDANLGDGTNTAGTVPVTPAQLLSNSSGLPEDNAWADRNLGLTREQVAEIARAGLPLSRLPGTVYQYSNIGQSLVGRAIETVTGRPVEDVITERLLDPLALTSTRFHPDDYPPGTDLARGFRTFDQGATFIPQPYVGSGAMGCTGGLFSTVDDVATWMWFLGSAFTDDPLRPDLLAPASRREMQLGRTPMAIGGDVLDQQIDARGYSLGLKVELHRRFGRLVSHSGGLPGFSSDMRWHTATGTGVVLFGNADGFNKATRVSERALLAVLDAAGAPAEYVRPWDTTRRAAEAIDAAIRGDEPLASLGEMLSPNLLMDVPDDVRRARLDALLVDVGRIRDVQLPFVQRIITSAHAAELRWRIDCERGALIVDIRLMALSTPLVQTVNVQVADETGRKPKGEAPLVIDHIGVVL